MSSRDESAIAAALDHEDGDWQLTLEGGAVKHPPPKPRGKCPDCEKLITFNDDGTFRHHHTYEGQVCAMSGRRLRDVA